MAALDRRPTDRVPLDIGGSFATGVNTMAYRNLKLHLGIDTRTSVASERSDIACVEDRVRSQLGIDTYPLSPGVPIDGLARLSDSSYRDEWGVVRHRASEGHYYVSQPPLASASIHDLNSYAWPDPDSPCWCHGLREGAARVRNETEYALVLSLPVGFGHQSQFLRGYEQWLVDCAADPKFAEALMDRVLEIQMHVAGHVLGAVGDLVDVVLYADDMGLQDRPIMSPHSYRKLVKPRQKRLVEFVKTRTPARVLYHTCGAVYSLIADFVDVGIDVLNPVQTTAAGMDPAKIKREFGRELAFWGAVDVQHLLPASTPLEVQRAVQELARVLGADGGYVVSAANNIQADTPPANVVAMARGCFRHSATHSPDV